MCTGKNILVKNVFKMAKYAKRTVLRVKTHPLSGNEKVPEVAVCKKSHADMKRPIAIVPSLKKLQL